jgi:hypothetical protein
MAPELWFVQVVVMPILLSIAAAVTVAKLSLANQERKDRRADLKVSIEAIWAASQAASKAVFNINMFLQQPEIVPWKAKIDDELSACWEAIGLLSMHARLHLPELKKECLEAFEAATAYTGMALECSLGKGAPIPPYAPCRDALLAVTHAAERFAKKELSRVR